MATVDLGYVVDFPTLGDLIDAWIERHCMVPDGFSRGKAFRQYDWQFWCTANHYRIRPEARWIPEQPLLNQAFVYRRSQVVAPQKTGKGPWAGAITAAEAVGPTIFYGWAEAGDKYFCAENGCPEAAGRGRGGKCSTPKGGGTRLKFFKKKPLARPPW